MHHELSAVARLCTSQQCFCCVTLMCEGHTTLGRACSMRCSCVLVPENQETPPLLPAIPADRPQPVRAPCAAVRVFRWHPWKEKWMPNKTRGLFQLPAQTATFRDSQKASCYMVVFHWYATEYFFHVTALINRRTPPPWLINTLPAVPGQKRAAPATKCGCWRWPWLASNGCCSGWSSCWASGRPSHELAAGSSITPAKVCNTRLPQK